jgi:alcohol dehydrogenase class IV
MEFNAARSPGLYGRVGTALDLEHADDHQIIDAIQMLFSRIGLEPGLRAHGVNESHLDELVSQAIEDPCHRTNPVPIMKEDLRTLYERAL